MQQNNGNIDKTLVFLKPDVFEKQAIFDKLDIL